jgi:DNA-binding NtrC family response regulator
MAETVLIVDDDDHLRRFVARGLQRAGYGAVTADSGKSGIQLLKEQRFDVVLCDLQMPEVDGIDVLKFAASLANPPPFVIITAYGSVSVAVEAMKHGAVDFLEKPVTIEDLLATIKNVLARKESAVKARTERAVEEAELVGSQEWLDPFLESVRRIAHNDATVLILGETGTGKSAVARQIWKASNRSKGPFIDINCPAIPEQLLERELFGHVKGAFTDASTNQSGKVEAANGGTLFLDEIGELRMELQSKLLQLLQERTFTPLGSSQSRKADVRFIAATNRDLPREVAEKRFRADLYYRLHVVTLTVPALRERQNDVPLLIEHFGRRVKEEMDLEPPQFSPQTLALLMRHRWPGNVRELEHLVQHMAIMHPPPRVIGPEMLGIALDLGEPGDGRPPKLPHDKPAEAAQKLGADEPAFQVQGFDMEEARRDWEIRTIRKALECSDGNQSQAARMLNMKRTTLIEKMKKYGISSGGEDGENGRIPNP